MANIILYHNPRCSKSRDALALLESRNIQAEVIRYLDTPPDFATLKTVFQKLGLDSPRGMMRVKDELYKTLGLDKAELSNEQLLQAIAEHPALLERPIAVVGNRAAIVRPLNNIEAILP
ncbi:arsenate reductase (glutaredoxin) [Neisseria sp. 83E34]|uniref:arsenate reductase (glutaredoxin) n=1 Tax=Neisseria sp. 83E34 TaxID=1692264 RepID=UPI0006CE7ED4|nr:arsenate reductase (glutaredoxin) [Neisseria sp. 83E34]KPN71213.1 arsenate reductase [Neisseria sp. 83E34]